MQCSPTRLSLTGAVRTADVVSRNRAWGGFNSLERISQQLAYLRTLRAAALLPRRPLPPLGAWRDSVPLASGLLSQCSGRQLHLHVLAVGALEGLWRRERAPACPVDRRAPRLAADLAIISSSFASKRVGMAAWLAPQAGAGGGPFAGQWSLGPGWGMQHHQAAAGSMEPCNIPLVPPAAPPPPQRTLPPPPPPQAAVAASQWPAALAAAWPQQQQKQQQQRQLEQQATSSIPGTWDAGSEGEGMSSSAGSEGDEEYTRRSQGSGETDPSEEAAPAGGRQLSRPIDHAQAPAPPLAAPQRPPPHARQGGCPQPQVAAEEPGGLQLLHPLTCEDVSQIVYHGTLEVPRELGATRLPALTAWTARCGSCRHPPKHRPAYLQQALHRLPH